MRPTKSAPTSRARAPLARMIGEHEWCVGRLDALETDVVRCQTEVEESAFCGTARHYLTKHDRRELAHRLAAAETQP